MVAAVGTAAAAAVVVAAAGVVLVATAAMDPAVAAMAEAMAATVATAAMAATEDTEDMAATEAMVDIEATEGTEATAKAMAKAARDPVMKARVMMATAMETVATRVMAVAVDIRTTAAISSKLLELTAATDPINTRAPGTYHLAS